MRTTEGFGAWATGTGLLGAMLALSGTTAFGAMYITPTGSTDNNGPVDASATLTAGNGTVTVTLTDLLQNPTSSGQTLSGIEFSVFGATGSATLGGSSGNTSTINSDGTYTTGQFTSPLGHWGADNSVNLSTIGIVGHMPFDLIIGPDSAGGFTGAGKYSAANNGLSNFNPYVLGTATFTVNVSGVTAGSTISGVIFEFGTNPDTVGGMSIGGIALPEPGAYGAWACMLALLPCGAGLLRTLRRRQPAA